MGLNLNQTQGQTFGPSGTNHAPGLVPDPGSVAGSTRFLREDAMFATPSIAIDSNLYLVGLNFIADGGGSALQSGNKGDVQIPFAGTITAVTLLADQIGSISMELLKAPFASYPPTISATGGHPPTLNGSIASTTTVLTGWSTAISAGDVVGFSVVSNASLVTRLTMCLTIMKS